MTTTTTETVAFPLPAAPSWAESTSVDGDVFHTRKLGPVSIDDGGTVGLELIRTDEIHIESMSVTVGRTLVRMEDYLFTADQARQVGEMFILAAELLDD